MRRLTVTLIVAAAAVVCALGLTSSDAQTTTLSEGFEAGGKTSYAASDPTIYDNYLMVKPQYALAYHRERGTPVWTSWHLDSAWLGSTPRQDDFRADTTLPAGWYRVQSTDYSGSGYDRGHMTPSGDRTLTVSDNSATF